MSSYQTLGEACSAGARYWSGRQSGPKPETREAQFLAGLLDEAAAKLKAIAPNAAAVDKIIEGDST